MTIDPHTVFAATVAAVFVVAGIDVGMAFLMRGVQESGPDD